MTLAGEALRSLKAAARILRHDDAGYGDFNVSVQGFWRSFAAYIPMLLLLRPLSEIDGQMLAEAVESQAAAPSSIAAEYVRILLIVALWPAAAGLLAKLLDSGRNFVRYMVAYNWANCVLFPLFALPNLLYLLGLPAGIAVGMILPILLFTAYLFWRIARVGLAAAAPKALAFVLADFTLSFAIGALI